MTTRTVVKQFFQTSNRLGETKIMKWEDHRVLLLTI